MPKFVALEHIFIVAAAHTATEDFGVATVLVVTKREIHVGFPGLPHRKCLHVATPKRLFSALFPSGKGSLHFLPLEGF